MARPGFDPNHIAARGMSPGNGLSVVASGSNFFDILRSQPGTITTAGVVPQVWSGLGPTVKYPLGVGAIRFSGLNTNFPGLPAVTLAVMYRATANAFGIFEDTSGVFKILNFSGNFAFYSGSNVISSLTVPNNVPLMLVASAPSGGMVNFMVLNLATGEVQTQVAGPTNSFNPTSGTVGLEDSNSGGGDFNIAAAMYSPAYMSMPQMLQWAQDPWSFWYPKAAVTKLTTTPVSIIAPPAPGIPDDPVFLGYRMFTQPMIILRSLRENQASDASGPLGVQPETNVHFVPRMSRASNLLLAQLRQSAANDLPQVTTADTPPSFIGKFVPSNIRVMPSLRQNTANDTSSPTSQPETNTHFIGKFAAPINFLLRSIRENIAADFSSTIAPETNVHFIGKFKGPMMTLLRLMRENQPSDTAGPLAVQPETNTHFIGRFTGPVNRLLQALRQNVAADFSSSIAPETNTHFIGKFTAPVLTLLRSYRENQPSDASGPLGVQPSTEPHFIGRLALKAITVLPWLRQNPATDVPFQPVVETNTHFIGKFRLSAIFSLLSYRQNIAADLTTATPQPSTEPHFIGRFTPPLVYLFRLLRENPATDLFRTIFLNPNYIASGVRGIVALGLQRQTIASTATRHRTIVGISNNVAQTNNLQPPIDATVEEETVCFDYGRILTAGASITGVISITCALAQDNIGTDATPQSRIIGTPQLAPSPNSGIANQAVLQLIGTMVGGCTYILQCVVSTSDGQRLSLWSYISCDTPA